MVTLRAVVHIGPVKTGTTAFAAAWSIAERSGEMPPAVLYPTGSWWFDDARRVVKHHQLRTSNAAERASRRRPLVAIDDLDYALAHSAAEARRRAIGGEATLLFVAEGLASQTDPTTLTAQLHRHVDHVEYVVVARRQDRAIGSRIAHGIKEISSLRERHLSVARFLSRPSQVRRFDYAAMLDGWRHDGARLHVIPFDEAAPGSMSLVNEICDHVGLDRPPASRAVSRRRVHASFDEDALRELAALKRRHSSLRWVPGAHERYRESFRAVHESAMRAAREGLSEPWRLSDHDARRVAALYRESNERFRTMLGDEADTPGWRSWFLSVGLATADSDTRSGDRA